MRLVASLCLLVAGLAGLLLAGLVQLEPACSAWFLPGSVDPSLLRTFLVADVVLLGAIPVAAARGVITGRSWGYAAACVYLGAISYATLWAWTSLASTGAGLTGALLMSPGAIAALWSAVILRPGGPVDAFPRSVDRTTPPGRLVILYDGSCRFCTAAIRALAARVRGDAFEALDLHDPSVGTRLPGLSHAALMRAMHAVHPDGRVEDALPAVLAALSSSPLFGALALLYRVPGITAIADVGYAVLARLRSRLPGRSCSDGACAVHLGARPDSSQETA